MYFVGAISKLLMFIKLFLSLKKENKKEWHQLDIAYSKLDKSLYLGLDIAVNIADNFLYKTNYQQASYLIGVRKV